MEASDIKEQMTDFDKTVEKLRQGFKSENTEGVIRNMGEIFPYVIHYLRERNNEKLRYLCEKLAHLTFDFDDGTKNLQIARQLGYLQALENVVRKITDSEVEREAFEALKKEPRYAELLSIIKIEGIVQHDELADKFGVSSERLHEIIKTIRPSEAITFITYGKMRYYNLTSAGEAIYDRLRKQAFLPELARRLKHIYRLVMDEGKRPEEVLRFIRPEGDDWCTKDEILPIIETLVDIREQRLAQIERGAWPVGFEPYLLKLISHYEGVSKEITEWPKPKLYLTEIRAGMLKSVLEQRYPTKKKVPEDLIHVLD